ncbi:hypothetical protein TNCV_3508021 [Trichonephila clavipes]|uniref:Uncharacterized protein n=1 Tax=Trichonephila clavipes TaxID=2585209 RepID=A0A8X6S4V6_TRICX|nr:hypothetical protein TNCV_3508021 [Trichonephila clavipes]
MLGSELSCKTQFSLTRVLPWRKQNALHVSVSTLLYDKSSMALGLKPDNGCHEFATQEPYELPNNKKYFGDGPLIFNFTNVTGTRGTSSFVHVVLMFFGSGGIKWKGWSSCFCSSQSQHVVAAVCFCRGGAFLKRLAIDCCVTCL